MAVSTLALILVTVFWGLTFPLIKVAVETLSPSQFVFYRFALSLLLFTPIALWKLKKADPKSLVEVCRVGFLMGALSWVSYQSQTIGLQYIESGRAAFLTGTNVIIVPFLSPLFKTGVPKTVDYLSAVGALIGLYLFADPSVQGIGEGDLWILLCAVFYATYVQLMQKWAIDGMDATLLAFFQICGLFSGSGVYILSRWERLVVPSFESFVGIVFCAVFATIGTIWIQSRYQRETTAERTALIFVLEPVFAAIFGFLILGEKLSPQGLVGCAIILISIAGSEFIKSKTSKVAIDRLN